MRDVANRPRALRGNAAGISNPSVHLHLHFRLTNPHWLGSLRDSSTLLIADPGGASPSDPVSPPLLDFSFLCFFSSQEANGPCPADVDDSRCKLSRNRQSNALTPHGPTRFCLVYAAATSNGILLICLQPRGLHNYTDLYRQPSHGRGMDLSVLLGSFSSLRPSQATYSYSYDTRAAWSESRVWC